MSKWYLGRKVWKRGKAYICSIFHLVFYKSSKEKFLLQIPIPDTSYFLENEVDRETEGVVRFDGHSIEGGIIHNKYSTSVLVTTRLNNKHSIEGGINHNKYSTSISNY